MYSLPYKKTFIIILSNFFWGGLILGVISDYSWVCIPESLLGGFREP